MDPGAHRGSQGTGGVDPGHRSVAKALEQAAPRLVAARLPHCLEHPQDVPTIALLRNGVTVATSVGVKFWCQIEAGLGLAES
jgi:hypothetical protein